MKTKNLNSNYPVRLAPHCDCSDCSTRTLTAGDYMVLALTILFIGAVYVLAR